MLLHLKPIYTFYLYLNPFRWEFNRLLKSYANEYQDVSKNALHVLMAMYDTINILNLFCKNCIVILDEGFVQTLTSVPHLQPIKDEVSVQKLVDKIFMKHDITVVNCNVDKRLCIERLRTRNSGDRFNAIVDDKKLYEALEIKQKNIDTVVKYCNRVITIDMNGNQETILEQIRKKLLKGQI